MSDDLVNMVEELLERIKELEREKSDVVLKYRDLIGHAWGCLDLLDKHFDDPLAFSKEISRRDNATFDAIAKIGRERAEQAEARERVLRGLLEQVRDACLFDCDEVPGHIGVSTDPYISTDFFQEMCNALAPEPVCTCDQPMELGLAERRLARENCPVPGHGGKPADREGG